MGKWATIRELALARGSTKQAILNRVNRGTVTAKMVDGIWLVDIDSLGIKKSGRKPNPPKPKRRPGRPRKTNWEPT